MNVHPTETFDLIVIGGGPAGSTVAALTAMQNHRVLLVERDAFPRYQIGESLLPATVHGICRVLGVTRELERQNFPVKRGGTFRWGKSEAPWTFYFSQSPNSPTGSAYQVERMKFDSILLENARSKGVNVRQQHRAKEILFDGSRAIGVVLVDALDREFAASARYVIDAGGSRSSFHKHCGQRVFSQFFQNVALYCYFENGKRLPPPNSGNILCVAFRDGWLWYIPLSDRLTSVGAVVSKEVLPLIRADPEKAMRGFIAAAPMVQEYLNNASRVTTGPYGIYRVRNDYSYCNTRFWSPGFAIIGDAACFVDPVFSSGVHLATYSGLLAARSVNTCLSRSALSEEACFDEFERRYRREFGNFYQFLVGFYDMQADEQSYFWTARKILNTTEKDNLAFVRLVAGLSEGEEPIFGSGREFFESRVGFGEWFENEMTGSTKSPQQVRVAELGSLHGKFDPVKFMEGFTSEIVQIQLQALHGEDRDPEQPLFSSNVIPAPDGLHWALTESR